MKSMSTRVSGHGRQRARVQVTSWTRSSVVTSLTIWQERPPAGTGRRGRRRVEPGAAGDAALRLIQPSLDVGPVLGGVEGVPQDGGLQLAEVHATPPGTKTRRWSRAEILLHGEGQA